MSYRTNELQVVPLFFLSVSLPNSVSFVFSTRLSPQALLDSLRQSLGRDSKSRDAQAADMRSFRESTIADHTLRIREADERYSMLAAAFDQEQKRAAYMVAQVTLEPH